MTIVQFFQNIFGTWNTQSDFLYQILGGALLLIIIDGILSFLFGGLSSFNRR